ncbi:MAG: nuclear transport factor 2 family protein [Actinomycetota bacterium]|nr:nuclear transport factor 2 family protein [Actinomycetota bacterium]
MSAADVELVRAVFTSLPESGYEALIAKAHPDFTMETLPGMAAEPQVYRGPEGMRLWWESFYEVMDEVRIEPDEIRDAGDGKVVVSFTMKARGQASGLEATQTAFMLIRLEGELMRRVDLFFSLEDALAAAG